MSRRPIVSIGMPVYNGGRFLGAAIDSLLAQEYGDFELNISDNCSTDDTQATCERAAARDPRVHYYRWDRNRGALANFSRVLELATGTYFMWASHDDLWSTNYLARLRAGFELGSNVILSAGHTSYITQDGDAGRFPDAKAPPHAIVEPEELVTQLLRQHATSWFYGLYDRSRLVPLLGTLGQFPGWGGDILFLFKLCLDYGVVGSDDAVIHKRVHPGASWASPQSEQAWRAWQREFSGFFVEEFLSSKLAWHRKAALLDDVIPYYWRTVINRGQARTPRQWVRRQLGRVWHDARRRIRG